MRYEKGHKAATRLKIVEHAARTFRKYGIDGVGVANLMAEAGLTHGGFYNHFATKEDLVQAAMDEAARGSRRRFANRIAEGGLEAWIRTYMRTEHRDHPELGCVVAALASELARHPQTSRKVFTENLNALLHEIEKRLPESKSALSKRQTAVGIFGLMVGAIQMARAVNDPQLSEEILESGIASALTMAALKPTAAR
jgi:TetR/AcrR family transcriptional repressor of nem operon